jgi:hypothetical protein
MENAEDRRKFTDHLLIIGGAIVGTLVLIGVVLMLFSQLGRAERDLRVDQEQVRQRIDLDRQDKRMDRLEMMVVTSTSAMMAGATALTNLSTTLNAREDIKLQGELAQKKLKLGPGP